MLMGRTNRGEGINGVSKTGLRALGADSQGWSAQGFTPDFSMYPQCGDSAYQTAYASPTNRCLFKGPDGNQLIYDWRHGNYDPSVQAPPCGSGGGAVNSRCQYTAADGSGAIYDPNDVPGPEDQSHPYGCANPTWNPDFGLWDCSSFTNRFYAKACQTPLPFFVERHDRAQGGPPPLWDSTTLNILPNPARMDAISFANANGIASGFVMYNTPAGCTGYPSPPPATPVLNATDPLAKYRTTPPQSVLDRLNQPILQTQQSQQTQPVTYTPAFTATSTPIQASSSSTDVATYEPPASLQPTPAKQPGNPVLAAQQQAQQQQLQQQASTAATTTAATGTDFVSQAESWVQNNTLLAVAGIAALLFFGSNRK